MPSKLTAGHLNTLLLAVLSHLSCPHRCQQELYCVELFANMAQPFLMHHLHDLSILPSPLLLGVLRDYLQMNVCSTSLSHRSMDVFFKFSLINATNPVELIGHSRSIPRRVGRTLYSQEVPCPSKPHPRWNPSGIDFVPVPICSE
ncbi:uncharacterized protein BT62DRAFT_727123 [Guyanagaster necrorhizus]|uniref:Secreted protein n=1 Tax=Guyanagaster necrorhizus TaxID=856835 RepID=A0A9P7VWE6_9AGAR|nr:uncharacterized protein BT62DRAFT_727123 [Guyanagaster necrorhizus MCA 3950]KAG7448771.1 hypothetical protein BT62DRAFT_727123 [Guyanagaster necrorhizus MCA 3950]